MTIKDLREALDPAIPIHILYMEDNITVHADDPIIIAAFGAFVVRHVYMNKDARALNVELKLEPVKA